MVPREVAKESAATARLRNRGKYLTEADALTRRVLRRRSPDTISASPSPLSACWQFETGAEQAEQVDAKAMSGSQLVSAGAGGNEGNEGAGDSTQNANAIIIIKTLAGITSFISSSVSEPSWAVRKRVIGAVRGHAVTSRHLRLGAALTPCWKECPQVSE
jgi:hypothetical protein